MSRLVLCLIQTVALATLFVSSAFGLERGEALLVDPQAFAASQIPKKGNSKGYAPLVYLDSRGSLRLAQSFEGKLIVADAKGAKEAELAVVNCGWSRTDVNTLIRDQFILVHCSDSQTRDFSLVELQDGRPAKASSFTGIHTVPSLLFNQDQTGFLEIAVENGSVQLRWFDFLKQASGPVVTIEGNLNLFNPHAKNSTNIHLFEADGHQMATVVADHVGDFSKITIATVDLATGSIVARIDQSDELKFSPCISSLLGSETVAIGGKSYLIARNGFATEKTCGVLRVNWSSPQKLQFALIDPLTLKPAKILTPTFKGTTKSYADLPPEALNRVLRVNGRVFLSRQATDAKSNGNGNGNAKADPYRDLGIDLATGEATFVPSTLLASRSHPNLALGLNTQMCWPNDRLESDVEIFVTDLEKNGAVVSTTRVRKLDDACRAYRDGFDLRTGGIVESRGQFFHIRGWSVQRGELQKIEITRVF